MIVSSRNVSVHPQKDGRSFVAEEHADTQEKLNDIKTVAGF